MSNKYKSFVSSAMFESAVITLHQRGYQLKMDTSDKHRGSWMVQSPYSPTWKYFDSDLSLLQYYNLNLNLNFK